MTPLLTLWPSAITGTLSVNTTALIAKDSEVSRLYRAVTCNGMTVPQLSAELSESYRSLIKLTMADTTLHVMAIVPLWESDIDARLALLADACHGISDKVSLHVIGLRVAMARVIATAPGDNAVDTEESNIAIMHRDATRGKFTFSLIDDYALSGAPLDFSLNSFSLYLSRLFTALIHNYHAILSPAILSTGHDMNIALGISTVSFDRDEATSRLLNRAFVSALTTAGIPDDTVDADKASDRAHRLLSGLVNRYNALLDKSIIPAYRRNGTADEASVVAEVRPLMKAEVKSMEDEITAILHDASLSFPEREAILALVLGRDNALLRGLQYDRKTLLLDDACSEAVNMYIDVFNSSMIDSGLLPVRGEYNLLKHYEWSLDEMDYVETPDNKEAFDPLPELKRLKLEILNDTAFIRRKTDELAILQANEETRLINENEIHGGDTDEEKRRRVTEEVKEQPLDDIYRPDESVKPKTSVDLRQFFSPVRDQGCLGSCTTFAAVSMYEAMMNRSTGGTTCADLSEKFVYYYSNVLKGKPEGGSNYHDQLHVLGKEGVCSEQLFGYTATDIAAQPSPEAIKDAECHRVLQALQIPLKSSGDTALALSENHRLLTSALTEGYPVGISLKIYDSFGKQGPFINRPDDNDISGGGESYHAMVVVGYSEREKCYIVRNSWGTSWGDKGYCYISSAYIDDPDFNNFACIITRTTDSDGTTRLDTPQLVAPFAGTENQIKIAAIRNILDEARVTLTGKQRLYDENYRYYQQLMQRLCVPGVRNDIRREAEKKTAGEIVRISSDKQDRLNSFIEELKTFKRNYIKGALGLTGTTLIIDTGVAIVPNTYMIIIGGIMTLLTIFTWLNYTWSKRKKRRLLNEQIALLAEEEARVRREFEEKQFRFHIAGMWIDMLHDMTLSVSKTYEHLVSFNRHLREWYEADSRTLTIRPSLTGSMFINLSDYDLWDKYFEVNKDTIVANIDLMDAFEGYALERETIDRARERLSRITRDAILPLFRDFNIVDFLMGHRYPYMPAVDLETLVTRLLNVGQPSSRLSGTDPSVPTRLILADVNDALMQSWQTRLYPYFPFRPTVVRTSAPCTLDLITIQPLTVTA